MRLRWYSPPFFGRTRANGLCPAKLLLWVPVLRLGEQPAQPVPTASARLRQAGKGQARSGHLTPWDTARCCVSLAETLSALIQWGLAVSLVRTGVLLTSGRGAGGPSDIGTVAGGSAVDSQQILRGPQSIPIPCSKTMCLECSFYIKVHSCFMMLFSPTDVTAACFNLLLFPPHCSLCSL